MDIQEENNIIADVIGGDSEAFGLLVNEYQRPIISLMLRMTGSREDALELAQDCFYKAFERLYLFKPGSRFFPWLYAVGMNLARDFLRRKGKNPISDEELRPDVPESSESAEANRPEEHLEAAEEIGMLNKGLSRLPHDQREAVILRYHKELSFKEISEALGISVSGVQMRVYRGIEELKRILGEDGRG